MGWSLATGFDKDEPRNVTEAMIGGNAVEWKEAMNKELTNLREKQTWQESCRPIGRKLVQDGSSKSSETQRVTS
jgi:hypothetical protein